MDSIIKDELVINVDFSSLAAIDKLIEVLKSNNIEVKGIDRDKYLIKL